MHYRLVALCAKTREVSTVHAASKCGYKSLTFIHGIHELLNRLSVSIQRSQTASVCCKIMFYTFVVVAVF